MYVSTRQLMASPRNEDGVFLFYPTRILITMMNGATTNYLHDFKHKSSLFCHSIKLFVKKI